MEKCLVYARFFPKSKSIYKQIELTYPREMYRKTPLIDIQIQVPVTKLQMPSTITDLICCWSETKYVSWFVMDYLACQILSLTCMQSTFFYLIGVCRYNNCVKIIHGMFSRFSVTVHWVVTITWIKLYCCYFRTVYGCVTIAESQ